MSTEISALRARVEEAKGPDRDLDLAVHAAITGRAVQWSKRPYFIWQDEPGGLQEVAPPSYTASLNAALELVEAKGFQWRVAGGPGAAPFAILNPPHATDNSDLIVKMDAATPALSVIAALLSALETQ